MNTSPLKVVNPLKDEIPVTNKAAPLVPKPMGAGPIDVNPKVVIPLILKSVPNPVLKPNCAIVAIPVTFKFFVTVVSIVAVSLTNKLLLTVTNPTLRSSLPRVTIPGKVSSSGVKILLLNVTTLLNVEMPPTNTSPVG